MTTVYTDYYVAYESGTMNIAQVNFLAMAVDKTYIPDASHKLEDVCGLIIAVPYVLTDNDIVTLSMSEITEKAEADIKEYIEQYPEQIFEDFKQIQEPFSKARNIVFFNPELQILCFAEEVNLNIQEDGEQV